MRNFMSGGLKDNPALAFGVLTGILCVSKENLFSGLNNLVANYFNNDCTPKPFWTNTSYGVAFCGKNVEIAL